MSGVCEVWNVNRNLVLLEDVSNVWGRLFEGPGSVIYRADCDFSTAVEMLKSVKVAQYTF
jgi:hypothetical protein